jgi:hypothetical protein
MSEWSMEAVLKTVELIAPGVRIPLSPINYIFCNAGEVPERPKGVAC